MRKKSLVFLVAMSMLLSMTACGYDTTLAESKIPGIYLGTYTYSNPNATYLEISEDDITLYHNADIYRYTYDQVTTTDNKNFTINDGSGANITLEYGDNFNDTAYYFFKREENGVYASVQGGPAQVLNGKHLYDINCDDMGVWGCIPVTEEIMTKLTEGLVTDDYWVEYRYDSSWYSEVKSKVQTYTIRDFDGPLASQALTLQVYADEEDAKSAYNYLQHQHQYTELNGNMIIYKQCEKPLATVDSYYLKEYFIGQSVYDQHCVMGIITEDSGWATYFSKPFSKEYGEYINQANILFGQHIGEYYGNDSANYSYIRLSTIYTGSYEMGVYANHSLADGSSLQFQSHYLTDIQVDGNKVTLISNDPMQETAAFLELVISENNVQATLKTYEGIYDLTIANSSSKTATKEASFVVQKEVY